MAPRLPPMTKTTSSLLMVALAFVVVPYLPRSVLLLVDFWLVRLGLLALVLAAAYVSPVTAIGTFAVVALLFIERNKAKVKTLRRAMSQSDMESPAIASIVTPDTAPEQPDFEEPTKDYHPFFPQEDSGDNMFHAVDESQDTKQPLETETVNGSDKAIHQLFDWVKPEMAQE